MTFDFIKESGRVEQSCEALSIIPTKNLWIVSISDQKMAHLINGTISHIYSVSTSKNQPSCIENSFGTPTGLHCAADKIGDGAPEGMVFKARVPTAKHFSACSLEEQARCLITTRIIRLRGLELGVNSGNGCDTFDRYVYIHGTNHEDKIGTPFSAGCVTLSNQAVITVFNSITEGDIISICN